MAREREKEGGEEAQGGGGGLNPQYKRGGQVSRARLVLRHRPSGAVGPFSSVK